MSTTSISSVITGKVVEILGREEYTNKQRTVVKEKLTFILDKGSQYNSKVAITILGEKIIDQASDIFSLGDMINCTVEVSSAKWNDRWFNNITYVSSIKM